MKLIWLDLETTGLDLEDDHILEIAVSETTLDKPFDARPIYHKVLSWNAKRPMDAFVRDMHTKNGLLDECYALPYDHLGDLIEAERELLALVPFDDKNKPTLAGSSFHFDHAFLKEHLPGFASAFSHRHYDVSAVKLFCQSLGMPPFPKAEAHRAREDVLESIDHAKKCAEWLYGQFPKRGIPWWAL